MNPTPKHFSTMVVFVLAKVLICHQPKEAIVLFQRAKILFAPGKASNAGGVATSGLEMTQNSLRYNWTRKEVDEKLKEIMGNIHDKCIKYGKDEKTGYIDYVKGANIAGFVKGCRCYAGPRGSLIFFTSKLKSFYNYRSFFCLCIIIPCFVVRYKYI